MRKIILVFLVMALVSVTVFAQTDQYEAIKQQLLSIMTEEQKQSFLALSDQEQRQFISQQIALANLRWQSEVAVDCGGVCVEGLPAIWQVRLSNLGQQNFLLQSVTLIDDFGNIFAERLVNLTIPPNQLGTINVQGILPPPSRSSTLYYRVVFVIDDNVQSEQSNRRISLMPMSEVECSNNLTCKDDEFCLGYRCMPLSALPENKTGRAPDIFGSGSVFYPWIIIVLLVAILVILLVKVPSKKK